MAIVDWTFYSTVYMGTEATQAGFAPLEAKAADVVGAMTRWKATAETIANLPPQISTLVKKAVCAQIDFFAINGFDSVAGGSDRGFTVGKVSIAGKSGSNLKSVGAMAESISPLALMYLEQTGLMCPAVPTSRSEPLTGWWF